MNKKALGLSTLGFLLFTAPAFAQDKKTESKEEQTVGDKSSSYKAEKTTKSGDPMKTTTDQDKVEKSTKTDAKGGTTTEVKETAKHPTGDPKSAKTTTKEKTETDSSGDVVKQEKEKTKK